jgi:transmembrane sensor
VPGDAQTQAALAEVEALWAGLDQVADHEAVIAMRAQALARTAGGVAAQPRRRWLAVAAALGVVAIGVGTVLAVRSGRRFHPPRHNWPCARWKMAQPGRVR